MECIDSKMRVRDQRGPQSWCAVFGFSCPDYCLPIEVLDNLSFLVSDLSDLSDLTVLRVPPSASDQAWAISNQLNMCSVPQSVPGLCVSTPPPHTHTHQTQLSSVEFAICILANTAKQGNVTCFAAMRLRGLKFESHTNVCGNDTQARGQMSRGMCPPYSIVKPWR